ncbi:hypothetical protein K7X08_035687 [Anisodus acutangulus]|uniref:Uncharacterized protein n=1 Tax=Anisodus acutangulus TaxID=402998 RepID=A0A9Q1RDP7_9SOLA|nr:hypothetical protein K7X08_035687 [Anisodus acutangulus]
MTQLDLVSPNCFAVLEDPEQEEAKMPDLDTAEPKKIAQDECLGNKAEEDVVKERTPEESNLAHRSEDLEERVNYGFDWFERTRKQMSIQWICSTFISFSLNHPKQKESQARR